jgi:hypothetical protein
MKGLVDYLTENCCGSGRCAPTSVPTQPAKALKRKRSQKEQDVADAPGFIAAQIVGGLLALGMSRLLFPKPMGSAELQQHWTVE